LDNILTYDRPFIFPPKKRSPLTKHQQPAIALSSPSQAIAPNQNQQKAIAPSSPQPQSDRTNQILTNSDRPLISLQQSDRLNPNIKKQRSPHHLLTTKRSPPTKNHQTAIALSSLQQKAI